MTATFESLGLPGPLLASLAQAGFETPTKIQSEAIPHQLKGKDILGIAQTGSGKTAAFGLPILAALQALPGRPRPMTARALILVPTRELAVQIDEALRKMAGSMRLTTVLVLGGVSRYNQVQKLAKGVDVCIATPGRMKDLVDDDKVWLSETRWLILDEADRMLDMGFIGPVKEIASKISWKRQTALFSATMAPEVSKLAEGLLRDPIRVEATVPGTTVAEIDQRVIMAGSKAKRDELNKLLADPALERVIVFTRTKHGADRVTKNLDIDGFEAAAIHGNKSQNARQAALKGFASGRVRILVATDIAARGIDVPGVTHVINYDLPDDAENYVHRIGRTGRNGASGVAITLCDGTEKGQLRDIEKLIRKSLPVSGDLSIVEVDPPKKAKGNNGRKPIPNAGAPRARKPAGKTLAGFNDGTRHSEPAPHRAHTDKKRKDGEAPRSRNGQPNGKPAAAKQGKPRWNKNQKEAGRARRAEGNRGRGERVA